MITDKHILSGLIKSRDTYLVLRDIISDKEISTQMLPIFNEVITFYEFDPSATRIDIDTLLSTLTRKFPRQAEFFSRALNNLPDISSSTNFINEILLYKRNIKGEELAGKLLNINSSYEDILNSIEEYKAIGGSTPKEEGVIIAKSLDSIIKTFSPEGLFPLYPASLNDRVNGGVPLHTHIGIIGPPESGKSLFAINTAAQAAKHGHKVLYIGNEDPIDMYIMRIINRITNMTRQEILTSPASASTILKNSGYDNIILDSTVPCRFNRIEKLINKYEPRYVIYDQLRQINIPGTDGDTAQLTSAVKEARRICKQYPIITISVTQAGDSAQNKLILDMGDCYMSNTTFPGDVDILIGWGTNDGFNAQNRRMVSLPKNKITGRHEHFSVLVDPAKSKIWSDT